MHSSVTPAPFKYGLNARTLSSSAEVAPAASRRSGFKLIDAPEIQVPRDGLLNAIALGLIYRGGNIDGVFQDLRHDVLRGRWVHDHGAVGARGNLALHGSVDHRDQDGGPKALKEMPINLARQP